MNLILALQMLTALPIDDDLRTDIHDIDWTFVPTQFDLDHIQPKPPREHERSRDTDLSERIATQLAASTFGD